MKNIGIVYGNSEQAKALVIGKDTVYVHTDITPIPEDEYGKPVKDLFRYNEVQYGKDEYLEFVVQQSEKLNNDITDTQLALCEIYETLGGAK